ncbi:MAG: hypothetical protein DHS20C15_20450 [Planctomycetota bacterium]|nr:MAG: hypothetical protein DHS20C15_20450 [Planctomycetota bacterium]
MTVDTKSLLNALQSPLSAAAAVDLTAADDARASLERSYPSNGDDARALRTLLLEAVEAGVICDRGDEPVRYSRLAKPSDATRDFSIDFVLMSGPGIPHRHPRGEINLCFATEGDARFDGQPEGWVTFAPDSRHIPTVSQGTMLIVYFLPGGDVEWIKPNEV